MKKCTLLSVIVLLTLVGGRVSALAVSDVDSNGCLAPYGLTLSHITGYSAEVAWQYDTTYGEAPGFVLTLTDADSVEVGFYYIAGDERGYILMGLSERTAYHLQLSVDCDGVDSVVADFVTPCNNGGEVQVGTGSSTSAYIPAYLYASSSFSQQLFTSADLAGVPVIQGFKVYMNNSAATPKRLWDIYLDTTSLTSYATSADYVLPSSANLYYSDSVSISQGWVEVMFDSFYVVPAGKSVVLTVNDRTGSTFTTRYFRNTVTSDNRAVYGYTASGVLDATSATAVSGANPSLLKRHNTIRFVTSCDSIMCFAPVITSAVADAHSVSLTWSPVGGTSEWKVEYRTGGGAWLLAAASVTDTFYTVTGLAATTNYGFRVTSLCGDEESSSTASATTVCGRETLPFRQTFEAFQASSYSAALTACWVRGSNYVGYYHYPYRESGFSQQGNFSLKMGGYRSYIVLPEMEVAVDSLSVSFYATNADPDSYYATVEVGVCTDPYDTTTFTVVASCPIDDNLWRHVEVDFDNYAGADGRIFIRAGQDIQSPLYIDVITVDVLPDCRRVTDAEVSDITTTSAILTITDHHHYGHYIVYYATVDDTAAADTLHLTDTTALLGGLPPNTRYYVWVQALCGEDSVGRTFAVPAFNTRCMSVVVTDEEPYLEEFEGGRLECMAVEGPEVLRWVVATGNDNVHAHSGSRMARLASENDYGSLLILPVFDLSALDEDAVFSFYRYQYHGDYGIDGHPAGRLEVYYRTVAGGDWTLLATPDSSVNSWERHLYTLPLSQGASFYQVAIKGYPQGNTVGLFVDDLKVSAAPACPMPDGVTVRNVGDRSATVAWTGAAVAYRVQYRTVGSLSWTGQIVEHADTVKLGPLDMSTQYEVRVAALCSTYEQSENSSAVTFTTDFCNNRVESSNFSNPSSNVTTTAPVNTSRNFYYSEILVDSATLAGMTEVNGLAFYIDTVGSAPYMTSCQLYMGHVAVSSMTGFCYGNNFVQVFDGDISATETGIRRVRFTTPFQWDGHSNVVLGIMYTTPDYYTHGNTWFAAHVSASAKVYWGGTLYTPFAPGQTDSLGAGEHGSSNVVPDLTFYSCLPVCYEPMLNAVTTTAESITVDWHNENAVVQVQIKEAASAEWDDPVVVNGSQHNIHTYTYNMLSPMTEYNIRLRCDCTASDIDYSDWVELDVSTDTICSIPMSVTVSDISATSATVVWTDGATSGNRWEVHVWNADEDLHYDVDSNPATLTGLTAGSSYQLAVRAHCCQYDRVVGEYSDPISFDNICQPVSGLTAQRAGSDIILSWHRGSRNINWLFAYGYEGFHPNQQLGFGTVQDTTVTVSGLEAGYIYTFRVRAQCGDGWNSGWSADVDLDLLDVVDADAAGVHFYLQPNPAAGRVLLGLDGLQSLAHVSIFSLDGRQVMAFNTSEQRLSIDISQLAAGTYFVHLQTDKGVDVRKLIVR